VQRAYCQVRKQQVSFLKKNTGSPGFLLPVRLNPSLKRMKIMAMYTCKTCGSMAPEPGHLCDPAQAGEMYTCEDCGRQAPLKKHICKPMVARFQYYCEACGRGAVAENKLCKPKPIV
jgi:DNA-directed RNA polymerase subunit RPC12/RpoP